VPIRFLHTADWQLGLKAVHAGSKAKAVRDRRLATAEAVAALARREAVDFVVIAGDLFEHHDVDDAVVRRAVKALDDLAPLPVYVLPGNHDPLVPGGVWDRSAWRRAGPHVHLLRHAGEVPMADGVVLLPAPLSQKHSTLDPTADLPPRGDGDTRIRIGVAHGALDILPERGNFPIAASRADDAGLDYLALGDWHGFVQHGRAVYPGTFEASSFGEREPGDVVIVEIAAAGATPRLARHRVGALTWTQHEPAIADGTDVDRLRRTILDAGPLAAQLLRVRPKLAADLPDEVVAELRALHRELGDEAFFLDWPSETLEVVSDAPLALPEGLLAAVDEDLRALADGRLPAVLAGNGAPQDPEALREARSLLARIAAEVRR
jgi:DNA repair exonuclease SbcCD nuclease subunit